MTVREALEQELTDHGLWPKEATTIVEEFSQQPEQKGVSFSTDPSTGYPAPLLAVLKASVKRAALDWLKANKPQHFAIHMLQA